MTGSDSNIANVVVIGGGVIGLAVTAEVSRYYDDVFLLEAMPRLGLGSSTRNSGVIHAGIYYPPGSLKATHCVRGSRLLYEFCEENRVPYRRTGKLIVVDDEKQLPELEDLKRRGDENGAIGLEIVDAKFIRRIEPNLKPALALYSPNTGIVDTDEYVKALARLAASRGASILTGTRLFGA
ncbi:MAG TPA: FAD-dependent oxidoreductase, partial [Blastocatellia bacterium]|nr:FAD-dependent oxidoreductase [Blastocatellia bacterium]